MVTNKSQCVKLTAFNDCSRCIQLIEKVFEAPCTYSSTCKFSQHLQTNVNKLIPCTDTERKLECNTGPPHTVKAEAMCKPRLFDRK